MRILTSALFLILAAPGYAQAPTPDFIASQLNRLMNGRMPLPPPGQRFPGQPQQTRPGNLSDTPSINCAAVAAKGRSAVGQILCDGRDGASADWDLNAVLWALAGLKSEPEQKALDKEQERWRAWLNGRCQLPNSTFGITPQQKLCTVKEFHSRAASLRAQLSGDALAESRLTPEQHAEIQLALIGRGLLSSPPDGEFGNDTRIAIKKFQDASGTAQTGFLTIGELNRLRGAAAPAAVAQAPSAPVPQTSSAPAAPLTNTPAPSATVPQQQPVAPTSIVAAASPEPPSPAPKDFKAAIADCDRLAGDPFDPQHRGDGVSVAKIESKRAIEACSDALSVDAENPRLLHQFARALFATGRYDEAFAQSNRGAALDYVPSQATLGFLYLNGKGVLADDQMALKWYRKAADQGNANAQFGLGFMYAAGRGVARDLSESRKWYQRAADQGNAAGQTGLGISLLNANPDDQTGMAWLRKASEQNYGPARAAICARELKGPDGLIDAQIASCYREAAAAEDALAQYGLGYAYKNGKGIARNAPLAITWLKRSAENGYSKAEFALGGIYLSGDKDAGVASDRAAAEAWFRKAAEHGNAEAKSQLADLNAVNDPDDVVAQVLNYSTFGQDEGYKANAAAIAAGLAGPEDGFWYKVGNCVYRLHPGGSTANLALLLAGLTGQTTSQILDLNSLDPKNITWQTYNDGTVVKHVNTVLTLSPTPINSERLERGWVLIYSKYCKGKEKPF
ncbi:peptidoglycan-binding protein [Bradyrhizobium diazoefficiens]